jgi:hypothetical protein
MSGPEQLSSSKHRRSQIKTGIAPENRNGVTIIARSKNPAPARGPQCRRRRDDPGPRAGCPGGGRRPGSGRPGRAVGRTRRGGRLGHRRPRRHQRRRRPAGPAGAREGRHRHAGQGQPARHRRRLEARRRACRRHGRRGPARPSPRWRHRRGPAGGGRHRAVTAEAAGSVVAIAEAADAAGKALAARDLPAALAALETAREQAAQGRRAVKAAASGRRAPATRPGALRDLVEEHLRKFSGTAFTPHQVGKVGRGRRSRRQRGDCGQRGVTRRRRGRDGTKPPGRAVRALYPGCTRARPACGAAGRSRRAAPPASRWRPGPSALTCAGTRQVHQRTIPGRIPPGRPSPAPPWRGHGDAWSGRRCRKVPGIEATPPLLHGRAAGPGRGLPPASAATGV